MGCSQISCWLHYPQRKLWNDAGIIQQIFKNFERMHAGIILRFWFDFQYQCEPASYLNHITKTMPASLKHQILSIFVCVYIEEASTSPASFLCLMLPKIMLPSILRFQYHSSITLGFCVAIIYMHCSFLYRHY